jgi:hypothetical protein
MLGASVALIGTRRFSDVDVERARLLHHYALDRASADAQSLADLQYARATPKLRRQKSVASRTPSV